jgi:hypothetical protein
LRAYFPCVIGEGEKIIVFLSMDSNPRIQKLKPVETG